LLARTTATTLGRVFIQGLALFGPAQSFAWPQAWVALAITLIGTGTSAALLWQTSKALLRERMSGLIHEGQPRLDKLLVIALMLTFVASLAVSSFDVWRWQVAAPLPSGAGVAGLAIMVLGTVLWIATLRANAFGSVAVKLQSERQQCVIDSGPYARVRHPMYTGILMVLIGQPVWLGSGLGFLVSLFGIVVLAVRCVHEERFLEAQLDGYAAYCARVRWRLCPGIW